MAMSRCLGCQGNRFETVVKEPAGSNFKMIFVQCATCGGVVGVTDYTHTHTAMVDQTKELKKAIEAVDRNVGIVNDNLGRIAQRISR